MSKNTILKILMAASAVVGGLMSAGILPAAFAAVPTCIGIISAVLHPTPAAISAFGASAK